MGFGGRVLDKGEPKYLNSPETVLFHKGKELYGLFEARRALRQIDRLLVVEGYMDVVALAEHGVRYAVATLGTATTPEHLKRLFRVCPEVIFCFDGDQAGLPDVDHRRRLTDQAHGLRWPEPEVHGVDGTHRPGVAIDEHPGTLEAEQAKERLKAL